MIKALAIADAIKGDITGLAELEADNVFTGQGHRKQKRPTEVRVRYIRTQALRRDTGIVRHFYDIDISRTGKNFETEDAKSREVQELGDKVTQRYDGKVSHLHSIVADSKFLRVRVFPNGPVSLYDDKGTYLGSAAKTLRTLVIRLEVDEQTIGDSDFQWECWTYNGVVVGGLNVRRYPLLSWDHAFNAGSLSVSFSAYITGGQDQRLETSDRVAELTKALRIESRSLGASAGKDRATFTLTKVGVFDEDLITLARSAGNVFTKTDAGQPIHIYNGSDPVGSFQIESVTDDDNIVIRVPAWDHALITALSGQFTGRLGVPVIVASEVHKIGGFNGRPGVVNDADSDDESVRRRVDFQCGFQVPALETRPDKYGLQQASVRRSQTAQGLDTVAFVGIFSAGNIAGVEQSARAVAEANLQDWITSELDKLNVGLGTSWEEVGGIEDEWDDREANLGFARVYREMNWPDGEAFNDPELVGASIKIKRVHQNVHGLKSGLQPLTVVVDYSSGVKAKGANRVEPENIPVKWAKIKRYIVARLRAMFGGTVTIESGVDPVVDPVSSFLEAQLTCIVSKTGSNIWAYDRTTSMDEDERLRIAEKLDGEDFTAIISTPGRLLIGAVDITVIQLGTPARVSGASLGLGSNLSVSIPSTGVFGIGEALPINIGGTALGSSDANSNTSAKEVWPTPGDPADLLGGQYSGQWRRLGRRVQRKVDYIGKDPDGVGSQLKRTITKYVAFYQWIGSDKERGGPAQLDGRNSDPIGEVTSRPVTPTGS